MLAVPVVPLSFDYVFYGSTTAAYVEIDLVAPMAHAAAQR